MRLTVAEVEHQLPTGGRRFASQLQRVLIQAGRVGLPHELAAHLFIRAPHFDTHWLRLDRLAILVAQQCVEQHGFARAIQVTRAEHKELQRVGGLPTDIELRQVQRGAVQAQQAGLLALLGQQHLGFFRQRQLGVAAVFGLALPEHAAFGIEDFQFDTVECLAAFQRLGKHIQAIGIAVHRQADITQGEQGGRLRIVVGA